MHQQTEFQETAFTYIKIYEVTYHKHGVHQRTTVSSPPSCIAVVIYHLHYDKGPEKPASRVNCIAVRGKKVPITVHAKVQTDSHTNNAPC